MDIPGITTGLQTPARRVQVKGWTEEELLEKFCRVQDSAQLLAACPALPTETLVFGEAQPFEVLNWRATLGASQVLVQDMQFADANAGGFGASCITTAVYGFLQQRALATVTPLTCAPLCVVAHFDDGVRAVPVVDTEELHVTYRIGHDPYSVLAKARAIYILTPCEATTVGCVYTWTYEICTTLPGHLAWAAVLTTAAALVRDVQDFHETASYVHGNINPYTVGMRPLRLYDFRRARPRTQRPWLLPGYFTFPEEDHHVSSIPYDIYCATVVAARMVHLAASLTQIMIYRGDLYQHATVILLDELRDASPAERRAKAKRVENLAIADFLTFEWLFGGVGAYPGRPKLNKAGGCFLFTREGLASQAVTHPYFSPCVYTALGLCMDTNPALGSGYLSVDMVVTILGELLSMKIVSRLQFREEPMIDVVLYATLQEGIPLVAAGCRKYCIDVMFPFDLVSDTQPTVHPYPLIGLPSCHDSARAPWQTTFHRHFFTEARVPAFTEADVGVVLDGHLGLGAALSLDPCTNELLLADDPRCEDMYYYGHRRILVGTRISYAQIFDLISGQRQSLCVYLSRLAARAYMIQRVLGYIAPNCVAYALCLLSGREVAPGRFEFSRVHACDESDEDQVRYFRGCTPAECLRRGSVATIINVPRSAASDGREVSVLDLMSMVCRVVDSTATPMDPIDKWDVCKIMAGYLIKATTELHTKTKYGHGNIHARVFLLAFTEASMIGALLTSFEHSLPSLHARPFRSGQLSSHSQTFTIGEFDKYCTLVVAAQVLHIAAILYSVLTQDLSHKEISVLVWDISAMAGLYAAGEAYPQRVPIVKRGTASVLGARLIIGPNYPRFFKANYYVDMGVCNDADPGLKEVSATFARALEILDDIELPELDRPALAAAAKTYVIPDEDARWTREGISPTQCALGLLRTLWSAHMVSTGLVTETSIPHRDISELESDHFAFRGDLYR